MLPLTKSHTCHEDITSSGEVSNLFFMLSLEVELHGVTEETQAKQRNKSLSNKTEEVGTKLDAQSIVRAHITRHKFNSSISKVKRRPPDPLFDLQVVYAIGTIIDLQS